MSFLNKLVAGLDRAVAAFGLIGGWLVVPMMLTIVYDVVGRKFFDTGSMMLQDLEWHLHGALFLLAFGYGMQRDAHVRIEIVRDRWSERRKLWVDTAGIVLCVLPYCYLVLRYGLDFAERAYVRHEVAPGGMGLPNRWIIKSMLPFGFAILAAAALAQLVRNVLTLAGAARRGPDGLPGPARAPIDVT